MTSYRDVRVAWQDRGYIPTGRYGGREPIEAEERESDVIAQVEGTRSRAAAECHRLERRLAWLDKQLRRKDLTSDQRGEMRRARAEIDYERKVLEALVIPERKQTGLPKHVRRDEHGRYYAAIRRELNGKRVLAYGTPRDTVEEARADVPHVEQRAIAKLATLQDQEPRESA